MRSRLSILPPPLALTAQLPRSPAPGALKISPIRDIAPAKHADVRRAEVLVEDGGPRRAVQQERRGGAAVPAAEGTFSPLEAEADEFRRWES